MRRNIFDFLYEILWILICIWLRIIIHHLELARQPFLHYSPKKAFTLIARTPEFSGIRHPNNSRQEFSGIIDFRGKFPRNSNISNFSFSSLSWKVKSSFPPFYSSRPTFLTLRSERGVWDQCKKYEYWRPTVDRPTTNDRPQGSYTHFGKIS